MRQVLYFIQTINLIRNHLSRVEVVVTKKDDSVARFGDDIFCDYFGRTSLVNISS